jgi:hypothetical protein
MSSLPSPGFTTYSVIIAITNPITFTHYPGFHLRNALVNAMAELHCKMSRPHGVVEGCAVCRYRQACLYLRLNLPAEGMDLVQPFIIDADNLLTGATYIHGQIEFKITFLGSASKYLPQWINAWEYIGTAMGIGKESGRFRLQAFDPLPAIVPIHPIFPETAKTTSITLYFRHLRLKTIRQSVPVLPFSRLLEMIYKRASALSSTYGNSDRVFPGLMPETDLVKEIENTETFTGCNYPYPSANRQNNYSFVNGTVTYRDVPIEYIPLLELGSQIGIGQFTSYGWGRYTLEYE